MPDTNDFFADFLPAKLKNGIDNVSGVFRFVIADAGTWTLDLDNKTLTEGDEGDADCTISSDKASWDKLISNPSSAMSLFMMGKIKADNIAKATQLQKILG
ncbi:MAG: SCP2 sterol-binding domain-containing protein [Alphaproteobacteria bacterium]|nr:SCP2 sterol-binding domain-containing protein [Alphaproteobacteria bacterium]MCB9792365.1 SCP2 sterol-binding domain-containing protein [Alphaproteobacteria bacterium]